MEVALGAAAQAEESKFPIHDAIDAGDHEKLATLLAPRILKSSSGDEYTLPPVGLHARDGEGLAPLHVAILKPDPRALELLFEAGVKATSPALEDVPPLSVAVAACGHQGLLPAAEACVALLLSRGAAPHERDDQQRNALHWAAEAGSPGVVPGLYAAAERWAADHHAVLVRAALADARAEAAAAAERGAGGGGAAAEGGPDGAADPLTAAAAARVERDVPPPPHLLECKDGSRESPLHTAARCASGDAARDAELIAALLDHGSISRDPGLAVRALAARNRAGLSPLGVAAAEGAEGGGAVLALVARAPGELRAPDWRGVSPLEALRVRGLGELAARAAALADEVSSGGGLGAAAGLLLRALERPADGAEAAADESAAPARAGVLVLAPPECWDHVTTPAGEAERGRSAPDPPPENVGRLARLTEPGRGALGLRRLVGSGVRVDARAGRRAALSDVLRVHDWAYVLRLQALVEAATAAPSGQARLDADTSISPGSWRAALAAAGAAVDAVDLALGDPEGSGEGGAENPPPPPRGVFCAIRPPGHHAGPSGTVPSGPDPVGSNGFCLLSNAAIAAAYALAIRRKLVRKVAILDFDVHHGNGTEACVVNAVAGERSVAFETPFSSSASIIFPVNKPWLDEGDHRRIFFASVQGFGSKAAGIEPQIYPGSGATSDNRPPPTAAVDGAGDAAGGRDAGSSVGDAKGGKVNGIAAACLAAATAAAAAPTPTLVPTDPEAEFAAPPGVPNPTAAPARAPHVIDVGIGGPGAKPDVWRRAWRDKILPALDAFEPDMIVISAGFDAHKRDEMNYEFVGVTEPDYAWLTGLIMQVAERRCAGRVVSLLEGGYRIQGGIVSAFSRSVAAHLEAMARPSSKRFDHGEQRAERRRELAAAQAKAEARRKKAVEKAERKAALERAALQGAALEEGGDAEPPATGPPPAADAPTAAAPAAGAPAKRRRRGATVDYAALNKQLEEQAARSGGSWQ